jgi:hypothetical protein
MISLTTTSCGGFAVDSTSRKAAAQPASSAGAPTGSPYRKPGRVTVPGKPSDDLAPGTLNSIFKQAGLKK